MIGSGALLEMENNHKYYSNLLECSKKIPCPSEYQIELDLQRTFPDEEKCLNNSFLQKLKNILICYSIRNSSIGYCQGMNFIVARLLLVIQNEEKVFWIFSQIIELILPLNYYSQLSGVITDTSLISILLEKYLPDLYSFFTNNNFELTVNNFIHKWLVCLFTQSFNEEMAYNFFDFFFIDGNVILVKECLAVFSILREKLLELKDFEEIYQCLSRETFKIHNSRMNMYFLTKRKFEFDNIEKLNIYREILKVPVYENLRKDRLRALKREKENNEEVDEIKFFKKGDEKIFSCDPKWPFCIYDESLNRDILEVFVIKEIKEPKIFDDYYYGICNEYPKENYNNENFLIDECFHFNINKNNKNNNNNVYFNVLCERQKHNCDDRKLIDNSIMFLDKDKIYSNNILEENDLDILSNENNIYKKLNKEKNFDDAKIIVIKNVGEINEIEHSEIKGDYKKNTQYSQFNKL